MSNQDCILIEPLPTTVCRQTKAVTYQVNDQGCWLCTSHQPRSKTYPIIKYQGRLQKLHRVVWMRENGAIPQGYFICHTCDNPRCINPKHLFLGTPRDNWVDMRQKERHKFHAFTPEERMNRDWRRGEAISWAILTEQDVKEIRNAPKYYGSGRVLAKQYGVSETTISAIRAGRIWKWLKK